VSGCDWEGVEAYALGELDGERAARVRAHLGACAACARELALVRAERRALAAYARRDARPLPAFEAVLARANARAPAPPARRAPPAWLGLGACAAAAAVVLQFLPGVGSPLPFSEGDPSAPACWLEEPPRSDLAVASAEDAFRACLVVTPNSPPPGSVGDDRDERSSGRGLQ
jgi:hypothetical protein